MSLGILYERVGDSVTQDYAIARDWYEKAAAKDFVMAMVALGHLYRDGRGVTPDLYKAEEWAEKAVAVFVRIPPPLPPKP